MTTQTAPDSLPAPAEPTAKEIEDVLNKVGNLLTEREMEGLAWIAANVRLP